MSDKDRVFYMLCQHCSSIMDGWIPYPSTCIAGTTGWRLCYVRKLLNELKKDGLIDSDLYVERVEERPVLIRGYIVTEKGKRTNEYRLAHEVERKVCRECFGIDIGDVNFSVELEKELGWLDC